MTVQILPRRSPSTSAEKQIPNFKLHNNYCNYMRTICQKISTIHPVISACYYMARGPALIFHPICIYFCKFISHFPSIHSFILLGIFFHEKPIRVGAPITSARRRHRRRASCFSVRARMELFGATCCYSCYNCWMSLHTTNIPCRSPSSIRHRALILFAFLCFFFRCI